ncbi:MAG: hypothetical protein FWE12_06140 [Oscillospiraceae bacterium]|nr:hypothetical protein [Oscillospiraceae bacterium]
MAWILLALMCAAFAIGALTIFTWAVQLGFALLGLLLGYTIMTSMRTRRQPEGKQAGKRKR